MKKSLYSFQVMSEKRNHHVIPKLYLKGFSPDLHEANPKVWVYEKGKPFFDGKNQKLENPRLRTTTKVASRKDFYAFEEIDGSKNYQKYEDILEQNFEKPNDSVLEKIRSFQAIEYEDKEKFSRYITSMILRGKQGQRVFSQAEVALRPEKRNELEKRKLADHEIKDRMEIFVKEQEKEAKGEREIKRKIEIAEKYAGYVCGLNWYFFIAPSRCKFITGDRPVLYNNFLNLGTWLIFPISSDVCLVAMSTPYSKHTNWKDKGNGYWEIDGNNFENLREIIVSSAIFELYFYKKAKWLVAFTNRRLDIRLSRLTISQILKR